MSIAENIVKAYYARQASTNTDGGWAQWAEDNPGAANLLFEAEQLCQ